MKKKLNRQDLIILLNDLVRKWPRTISGTNQEHAFREIERRYPSLLTYDAFQDIYVPMKGINRIADEIMKAHGLSVRSDSNKIMNLRSVSSDNKIMLEAYKILMRPSQVLWNEQVTMEPGTFHYHLRQAYQRREKGKSVDEYFDEFDCPSEAKKLFARSLVILYKTGLIFRYEWYKNSRERSIVVKLMLASGPYHKDASRFTRNRSIRGRQVTRKQIQNDARLFLKYLTEGASKKRDKEFYHTKRFRFLTWVISKIESLFNKRRAPINPSKAFAIPENNAGIANYSIDKRLNSMFKERENKKKKRPVHGVLVADLPSLSLEGVGKTSNSLHT